MTAVREAFVLPVVFLTVALLGGLRTAENVRLVPPPLAALVLGMLMLAALTRSRVLVPDYFMNSLRGVLENANGAVVILTLYAASAQVFNLLIPDRGLFFLIFTVFFGVQLLTSLAAIEERGRMLRAVAVLLGAAFVLRFIVLEPLYGEEPTMLKRVLTVMLEGVTLGGVDYTAHSVATGYAAFAGIALYLLGLALLPRSSASSALERRPADPDALASRTAILLLLIASAGCRGAEPPKQTPSSVGEAKASSGPAGAQATPEAAKLAQFREEALRAAKVWQQPSIPVRNVDLAANPPDAGTLQTNADISCRFRMEKVGGTTSKFNCELAGGEVVKVKYGWANPEIHAEVAATRLLAALGFGADRMYLVRKVTCQGCPAFPFQALKCLEQTGLEKACFPTGINYAHANTFAPAVIERRMPGRTIEAVDDQGWAWFELGRIDAVHGGSPRHEVDALRLIAMVLAHWDNKSENQRLICLPDGDRAGQPCPKPFALIQDAGGTFGPVKLDLGNWRATPVWVDPRACRVSMKALPFNGATFPDAQISDEGRMLLLGLLEQLSSEQLKQLFTGSGITSFDALSAEARSPDAWAKVLQDKIRQIKDAGPCPPVRSLTDRPSS